jgi:hypothetical protein
MPDAGRRTRIWLWVLGAVIVALVAALVVVLVTRDDDDDQASTTTTTSSTTTTTRAITTTTGGATTTTAAGTTTTGPPSTTVPLPVVTDDPQTYAQYLYTAWRNNDRASAANVASSDAVTQMFARAYPSGGPYTLSGCNPAAGSLYCTFNGQGGASIQMQVRTLTGGLPIQVRAVQFAP